jgi:hypothetical protein
LELGDIEGLVNLLLHNSSVTRLGLKDLDIGDEGAKHIALLIQHNTLILDIKFNENHIGAEGAKALAEAIKINSTLQMICIQLTSGTMVLELKEPKI